LDRCAAEDDVRSDRHAIADEEPGAAASIVENALRSIPRPMRHYAPDGGGTEGATYWDLGTRFNVLFLASLEAALGTDFELSAIPGWADSGLYQLYMAGADRVAFDFADCGLRRLTAPAHFWMAHKFHRPEYSWFRYGELADPAREGTVLDLLWYDPQGKDFDPARLPLDKYFRGAEWVSMRSSFTDPNAMALAVQGGDTHNSRATGTWISGHSLSTRWGSGGSWTPGWTTRPTSRTTTTSNDRISTASAQRATTRWWSIPIEVRTSP
jgi:hypothetical protein